MKCIFICAGYATRLFPLTENFPKALLEIEEGKPLLDYILNEVNTIDIVDSIYLVTNDRYYSHFNNWAKNKNNIKPIKVLNDGTKSNDDRLGAIGDIKFVLDNEKINDDVIIIAGDSLFDYKLMDVINYYKMKNAPVVCAKKENDYELLKRVAVAKVDENNKILDFVEKPEKPNSDIGVYATYIYPKEILKEFDKYLESGHNPDAPGHFIEYLYKKIPTYVYQFKGNFYDVGTHESLAQVRKLYNN